MWITRPGMAIMCQDDTISQNDKIQRNDEIRMTNDEKHRENRAAQGCASREMSRLLYVRRRSVSLLCLQRLPETGSLNEIKPDFKVGKRFVGGRSDFVIRISSLVMMTNREK